MIFLPWGLFTIAPKLPDWRPGASLSKIQAVAQSPAKVNPPISTAQIVPPPPQAQDAPDTHPPAVSGGTPTVTDAAEVSFPGWIEFDPGVLKSLERDSLFGTPFTFKYTALNNRLQYLLGFDGYVRQDSHTTGMGDTYPGVHYIFLTQEKKGFDVAGKLIVKIPTATNQIGTGRMDYSGFVLASRDLTKWGLHSDFNAGVTALSRGNGPGYDNQVLLSASTTSPITGGRWQYTNELVYFSPMPGQDYHLTMMHGLSYAVHRYATYSAAVQVAFHGDIPRYQLLVAASFNLGKL